MSQLNHAPSSSCNKYDLTTEDESHPSKASSTKLIEMPARDHNFLQVFERRTSICPKPLLSVSRETLALRCQQPCQNISFKSLPLLGVRDSLENILIIRRYNEFPQRNLLKSFIKANSLERRPRRRLCQNKAETVVGCNEPNTSKSKTCPEVNVRKLRYQLAKERKVFNRFSIGRFGQNIKNRMRGETWKGQRGSALYQGLSYNEVASLCKDDTITLQILSTDCKASRSSRCPDIETAIEESKLESRPASSLPTPLNDSNSSMKMLHLLEKLNLNPAECETIMKLKPLGASQQMPDHDTLETLSTWISDDSIQNQVDRTNLVEEYHKESGSEFQEFKIESKTACSPRTETARDSSSTDLQSYGSRVDFSSGDDARNLTSRFMLDEAESVRKMTCAEERRNHDFESRRRSVQWNSEVDVIYYAGDTDGGKLIRRKMEPLREEADQQARRSGFIKFALRRNLISAFNVQKIRDPWVTQYQK